MRNNMNKSLGGTKKKCYKYFDIYAHEIQISRLFLVGNIMHFTDDGA